MTGAGGFTGVGAIAPIEKPLLIPSPAVNTRTKKKKVREEALELVNRLLPPKNSR